MTDSKLTAEVPTDEFHGKDPLLDCLMSALYDTEKDTEPRIKVEEDGHGQNIELAQLKEALQQKEFLAQSKNELLGVKEEALRTSKELLAQKDKIIEVIYSTTEFSTRRISLQFTSTNLLQIREDDLQQASRLISARDQTVLEKDQIIRNHEASLQVAQLTIMTQEETIAEKSQAVKNAKQPRKEVYIQLAKKDKVIESHKEYIERQKQTIERLNENLRVKGIKNMELDKKWANKVAELKSVVQGKDFEIGVLKTKLERSKLESLSRTPKIEEGSEIEDAVSEEGEILSPRIKVKAEPMDY